MTFQTQLAALCWLLCILPMTVKSDTFFTSFTVDASDAATLAVIILLLLVIICAQIYSCMFSIGDYSFLKLLAGLFYIWDFYSDVVWAWYLAENWDEYKIMEYVFYAAVFFILFPISSNVFVLWNAQRIWGRSTEICPNHFNRYFESYSTEILLLTVFSGSAFAAIELANVRLVSVLVARSFCILFGMFLFFFFRIFSASRSVCKL